MPAATLMLLAGSSFADVEQRIARCAEAGTSEARIACLEADLRELAASAPNVELAPDAHEQAPAAAEPALPAPAAAAATEEQQPPDAPVEVAPRPGAAEAPPPVASEAPVPADAARVAEEVELGAEQVAAREGSADEEEPRVRARVVDFRFVGYRRLLVQLDNGQIWRQIDGDRTSVERGLRDAETFEIEMWATRLGGYRMHIVPLDRTLRVERLK